LLNGVEALLGPPTPSSVIDPPNELAETEIEKIVAIMNVRSLRMVVSMTPPGPERPDAAKGLDRRTPWIEKCGHPRRSPSERTLRRG
jgi:hypothetical protein